MEATVESYTIWLAVGLALSEVLYERAHWIVGQAPDHPAGALIRFVIAARGALVAVGILSLAVYHLYPIALLSLLAATVTALGIAVFLLLGARQVRDQISRVTARARSAAKLSGVVAAAVDGDDVTEDPAGSISSNSGPVSLRSSQGEPRSAIDALRAQRQITQALWDTPSALVLINRGGRILYRTGGATRSAGFPEELMQYHLPEGSEIGRVVAEVLRTSRRYPIEIRRNGRVLQGVASPWFTGAGSVRGVAVNLMCTDEPSQTDEADALLVS